MGWLNGLFIVLFWWGFLVPTTYELQSYETQILLQLRKHLEYPMPLDIWQNFDGDLCFLSPTPRMSISCQGNSVTELKIMGDKLPSAQVSDGYSGFPVHNQTLSDSFSMDSFVTTLTRLTNLRVLSLVSLGIWGPLPDKIHRLYSLEVLDMSSNFMFGSIPAQISRMVRVHTMVFDGNFFNDTVPDWLDSLSNLTVLSVKNNRLKGSFPHSLSRVTSLTDVVLSHNAISGELPDLSALSNLHLLDLRENRLDSELPALPSGLTTLLLSNNSFSGAVPSQLGKLNQLQHLDLSRNSLSGMPPSELFSLPNISYLNLASNMLSGSLPRSMNCGEALGFVDISSNRLVGSLPSCLDSTSGKRIVKYGMNCLSIDTKNQHSKSFCQEASTSQRKHFPGKAIALLVGVVGGIMIIVVLLAVGLFIFCRKTASRGPVNLHSAPKVVLDNSASTMSSELLANARIISQAAKMGTQGNLVYRLFSMEELAEATHRFDPSVLLGEGSIGKIYKGKLENGSYVAIRSLILHKKFLIRNLKLRLDLLSKLRHPHLVNLLGHCIDGGMQDDSAVNRVFLVYEFVPNGNFRAYLSETSPEKVLKWSDRLAVLIGVAKAVHFLHTGVIPPSTSNRLKTKNILLDEHLIAKLSDYGMSIITEETDKSEAKGDSSKQRNVTKLGDDVYNFGFILLESLVGPVVRDKGEAFLLDEMVSIAKSESILFY
ncbi:OLC1v1011803C4 [Oldenlandia corymbosa var. corymbosa]|uniref:OLC1v1011803C4 n=1 Tax=Oldenlandia corymbosa var. corymbosa TaxID=529605 RepID=A0AAV1DUJ6_OLDCO|nr:OLC1v1011803C4 [Oldenlandia corymbosa var. corymbosa]